MSREIHIRFLIPGRIIIIPPQFINNSGIISIPVALDQACVDIVYNTPRKESGALIERIESRNGIHTLEHAEEIGLGSRNYNLVNIDK